MPHIELMRITIANVDYGLLELIEPNTMESQTCLFVVRPSAVVK